MLDPSEVEHVLEPVILEVLARRPTGGHLPSDVARACIRRSVAPDGAGASGRASSRGGAERRRGAADQACHRAAARPARARALPADEPTSGLYPADIALLLRQLHRPVDVGNTVVLVEHDLDTIATADWVIDLGPGSGDAGGRVVVTGTPAQVAPSRDSRTAPYLAKRLG